VTESSDLAGRLFNDCTVTGTLHLATWCDFKSQHGVEPQQIEPVLV
jgi:hypothetical protein